MSFNPADHPGSITRALMAMVHEDAGVEEALQHLVPS